LIETDNKEVRKILSTALEKIRQETHTKMTCLETVRSGFRVNAYLAAKAKAAIELPSRKTSAMRALENISGEISHPVLYNRLKAWRDQKAEASGQPQYMIIPRSTLATLVSILPQNMQALRKVKGMGKVKSARYGEELIELIKTYCKENNLESSPIPTTSSAVPATRVKIDTRAVSYNLFKGGKTVQEIAAERRMAASTIEGHLAHYIGTGELSVSEFVSSDITALIASHFEGQGDFQYGPVKAALGEQVSWSELRFVVKHLEFLKKLQNDRQKS
jgi:ribonuclease D